MAKKLAPKKLEPMHPGEGSKEYFILCRDAGRIAAYARVTRFHGISMVMEFGHLPGALDERRLRAPLGVPFAHRACCIPRLAALSVIPGHAFGAHRSGKNRGPDGRRVGDVSGHNGRNRAAAEFPTDAGRDETE